MMDTVWIRLTTIVKTEGSAETEQEENFMFGPTGVVRFATSGDKTSLINSNRAVVAEVSEDSEFIMNILRKMRGTEGKLNEKQSKAAPSKRTSPKSKAPRKTK